MKVLCCILKLSAQLRKPILRMRKRSANSETETLLARSTDGKDGFTL